MKHRFSAIRSLANFNIFKGTMFIPITLFLQRLDIISRISFLVQRNIRNDSLLGSVK